MLLEKKARGFIKCAGGKTRLLPELLSRLPETFGHYHEPFVGGGALYWPLVTSGRLSRSIARLSDANTALVRAYWIVQESVDHLVHRLSSMQNEKAFFLSARERFSRYLTNEPACALPKPSVHDVEIATLLIYLNKTCFNGLYRVNAKGEFNVPFGRYDHPTICDEENLRACSRAMRKTRTEIEAMPFERVLEYARPKDVVYMDPPYMPTSKTSSFTSYGAGGFGLEDHRRLRDIALELKRRDVHVLISNSDTPETRELYASRAFQIETVTAPRSIAASAAKRGSITELVIR